MSSMPKKKVAPLPKKKVVPSEKVTPSEKIEKVTTFFNNMEEPVLMISKKGVDNYYGKSKASTGLFNLDHEWFKIKFSTLEPDIWIETFENIIEGQDIRTYKIFVVPLDNTKVNLSMHNDSVIPNKKKN